MMYDWLKINMVSSFDEDRLAMDLSQLSEPHAEAVQVLIIHHYTMEGDQSAMPANSMLLTKDNGVRYPDINGLPITLLRILATYVEHAIKLSS